MAKQEYLQQAHKLDLSKTGVAGRLVSEKLDGQRFMWDGGVSRGLLAADVPYANTQKDERYLAPQRATGLWSRYGKAIQAPAWWLDKLPPFPCEGELWTGHGEFQRVSSIVRSSVNVSEEWPSVVARVFDAPPPVVFFRPRRINPNANVDFTITAFAYDWWLKRFEALGLSLRATRLTVANTPFHQRLKYLHMNLEPNPNCSVVSQIQLVHSTDTASEQLNAYTDSVLELGGEGTMIKSPNDLWLPERVHSLLKYKPYYDAEGVVVGWTWGRKTDRGSKLLGKMGAVILESKGVQFKMSGFTHQEREMQLLQSVDVESVAGQRVDPDVAQSSHFTVGSEISYKYRELSDDGVPKDARYWRKPCRI